MSSKCHVPLELVAVVPAHSESSHQHRQPLRELSIFDQELQRCLPGLTRSVGRSQFVKTNIFGTAASLLLAGIPLPTIDDVVAAMIAASSKPKTSGSAFVVDFKYA